MHALLSQLDAHKELSLSAWRALLEEGSLPQAQALAQKRAQEQFGTAIYVRGIVECTNHCKNNCYYCGLQASNKELTRYRLSHEEILAACATGYKLGIRTFVLQGGEDPILSDAWLLDLIRRCKDRFPDCAITLSFGERQEQSYAALFQAGADRYLLRHEAASPDLYQALHPEYQRFWHRITCLYTLKNIGFQTGCGMMVGVPGQTKADLAWDMAFIQDFKPAMLGIGPFLPHHATRLHASPPGDKDTTLYLLSLARIANPRLLLPATTALRALHREGLVDGVRHGANVLMPSLTPQEAQANYTLYDAQKGLQSLEERLTQYADDLARIGYHLVVDRGDYEPDPNQALAPKESS